MKPPKFLKTIVNIVFILLFAKFVISMIAFFYILFGGGVKLESISLGENVIIPESFLTTIILFILQLLLSALFLYAVYVIKKLIEDLDKGDLYSKIQISGLNLVGKLLILVTVINAVVDFFSKAIVDRRIGVSITLENGFGSFWLIIAIGLFFIYLSKVFANSARLKEENELTV